MGKFVLTKEMIEEYLGKPVRQRQNELEWQCPFCAENGGDNSRNNLKFNIKKGILYCFADPSHSKIIWNEICKQNQVASDDDSANELSDELKEKFMEKFNKYREIIDNPNNERLFDILLQKRGITFETALEVGLGYNTDFYSWAIPIFRYSTNIDPAAYEIIGFEYRPLNFEKNIIREPNSKSALAMINPYNKDAEILVIIEGFLDAYALFQYLSEKGQINYYHIVTCSNGVSGLIKQIDEIDFAKYKQWILFMDNDEAGRTAASEILEKYPFIRDFTLSCGCKDFNEHYLKCIEPKPDNNLLYQIHRCNKT